MMNKVLVVLLATLLVQECMSQVNYDIEYQLPLTVTPLPTRENTLADGSCCESSETAPNCTTACPRLRVQLCLRELDSNEDQILACPLGLINMAPGDGDIIGTFSQRPNIISSSTYQGSYEVGFAVFALNPSRADIDSGVVVFSHNITDSESSDFNTESITGNNTVLGFPGIRVVCKAGYFGPDCGCSPRDDSTGHFTCAADGSIQCLEGYQNTVTNCVELIPTTQALTTIAATTIDQETTQTSTTTASTTMASTDAPSPNILPAAVGGAVGGVIVLVLIILIILVVVCCCVCKRESDQPKTEDINLVSMSSNQPNGYENAPVYSEVVKKQRKTSEPPPIAPYTGSIYSEVGKTGLFEDSKEQDPQYSTVNVTASTENYSVINASSEGYSEIDAGINKPPQLMYADLAISPVPKGKPEPSSDTSTYTNLQSTGDVQYSHIQTLQ